jgi:hypothetical protein
MQSDTTNNYFDLASRFVQHTGKNLFLTGKAGTGKTTFLKHIREQCSKKTAVVAPTGVAAINAGGVTLHTFFQLPLGAFVPAGIVPDSAEQLFNNKQTLLGNLRLSQPKRELMRELELLVIDEVSMMRADILDAIDVILRHIRKKPGQPFGGVQVIFIGDLFQLPPVISEKEWQFLKEHYDSPFFFDAKVLKESQPVFLELKKIYRQNEQSFIDLLNKVRNNELEEGDLQWLNSRYQYGFQPDASEQFITLTTHNSRADAINQQALSQLTEESFYFPAEIKGDFSEKAFPADEQLVLKKGAQVMFIKNDKGEDRRFYNGRLGIVNEIAENNIQIRFAGEEGTLVLERETWRNIRYQYNKAKDSIEEEELGTFSQYPVRLAWAITIHKSQGLTFEKAIIDAGAAFAPGQVYVALSRLTNLEGMVLRSRIGQSAIQTDRRVVQFATGEKGLSLLEEDLFQGEQIFIKESLLKAFNLESLKDQSELWVHEIEKKNSAARLKAVEWALTFREQMAQLGPVARKTVDHLETCLKPGDAAGLAHLVERTLAASGYFTTAIRRIIEGLKLHAESILKEPRIGKYLRELSSIEAALLIRIGHIQKAVQLTTAMAAGDSPVNILNLITERTTIEPTGLQSNERTISDRSEKNKSSLSGAVIKKERRVKGETSRNSLELFLSGKSISEIAAERTLAISTIHNHLIGFVITGELAIEQLVSQEKIDAIKKGVASLDTQHLGPLKNLLGNDYSFDEIRAVIAHLTSLKKS